MPQGNRDLKAEARRIQQEQGVKYTEARRQAEALANESSNPLQEWWNMITPPKGYGMKWSHDPQAQEITLSRYHHDRDDDVVLLTCSIARFGSHSIQLNRPELRLPEDDDEWTYDLTRDLLNAGVPIGDLGYGHGEFLLIRDDPERLLAFTEMLVSFARQHSDEFSWATLSMHSIWTSASGDQPANWAQLHLDGLAGASEKSMTITPADSLDNMERKLNTLLDEMTHRYNSMRGQNQHKWDGNPLFLVVDYRNGEGGRRRPVLESLTLDKIRPTYLELLRKSRAAGIFVHAITDLEYDYFRGWDHQAASNFIMVDDRVM